MAVLAAVLVGWMGARGALWEGVVSAGQKVIHVAGIPPRRAVGGRAMMRRQGAAWPWAGGNGGAPVVWGKARGEGPTGQQVMGAAALALVPLPDGLGEGRKGAEAANGAVPVAEPLSGGGLAGGGLAGQAHWSGDGWMLVRRGGDGPGAGSGLYGPTYGANQIGAVVRYRLDADDAHRTSLYLRGYGAMNGTGEREAALGLSGRLIARVPVVAMVEMRVSQFMSGQTHVRAGASMVTQLPPFRVMRGVEAEVYGQGGYVGGAAHTPFVDGQMRVEHVVEHLGRAELRLGMGAWGGAQEGAGRLDLGPTARVSIMSGRVGMRVAVDWRMRVEGNAAPTSGPALTLSAGF